MSNEPVVTLVGNLTGDPELKFLPSGGGVVNFTVAQTPFKFNRDTNQREDMETIFMRCTAWREMGENVAESLHRGDRVVVTGRLVSRSWEDKDSGQKRTVMEMQVDEVGPSLRFATATVRKAERQQQGGQQQGGQQQGAWGPPQQGGQQQGAWGPPQGQQPPQQQGPPPQQQGGGDPWAQPQGQAPGWAQQEPPY